MLVHQSGHIKLSDMGSSRFFSEVRASESSRLEGTAEYLAPEILRGEGISPASDLWAFACCVFQIIAGRTPMFEDEPPASSKTRKRKVTGKSVGTGAESEGANKKSIGALRVVVVDPSKLASMTDGEREAHRTDEMARHNEEQKQDLLRKMVAFEQKAGGGGDTFPDNFDPQARDLIERIMKPNPAERLGVTSAPSSSSDAGVRWIVDWSRVKSHAFFAGIEWDTLHTHPAPSFAGGGVAPAPDSAWARRKNSIMWAPMPKSFQFTEGAGVMDAIVEDRTKEVPRDASNLGSGGGGGASLRAQLFQSKNGSASMAPRFGGGGRLAGLSSAGEDEEGDVSMKLIEGEEEGEDDENEDDDDEEDEDDGDDDDDDSSMDLSSSMSTAPLPTSSVGSAQPRVRKPSSRASGPMAVVESLKDDPSDESSVSILSNVASLPPRPVVRPSIGLRSHLPPSGNFASAPLPTGALPPKPSTMFSTVPRADPTAGPTSLGMGVRKMGGNSTASALLARIMTKPGTPPTADLSNSSIAPSASSSSPSSSSQPSSGKL